MKKAPAKRDEWRWYEEREEGEGEGIEGLHDGTVAKMTLPIP